MKVITDTIQELKINLNLGMISFVLMRITGIALTLYIFAHLITLGAVLLGDESFNASLAKFDSPIGHIMEYALLLCVAFHMINGLRIILTDFLGLTRAHEHLFWYGMGTLFVLAVVSIFVFF